MLSRTFSELSQLIVQILDTAFLSPPFGDNFFARCYAFKISDFASTGFFRFVTMPVLDRQTAGRTDGQTDRRTDRILIARPPLHYMQRGKNVLYSYLRSIRANDLQHEVAALLNL